MLIGEFVGDAEEQLVGLRGAQSGSTADAARGGTDEETRVGRVLRWSVGPADGVGPCDPPVPVVGVGRWVPFPVARIPLRVTRCTG